MENLGAGKFTAKLARLEKTLRYRVGHGAFYFADIHRRSRRSAGNRQRPTDYSIRRPIPGLASVSAPEGNIEGLKGSTPAARRRHAPKIRQSGDRHGRRQEDSAENRRPQASGEPRAVSIAVLSNRSGRRPRFSAIRRSPTSCESNRMVFPPSTCCDRRKTWKSTAMRFLSLEYSARDDFGIGEVTLITKIGDREEKITLQKDDAKRLDRARSVQMGSRQTGARATAKKRCFFFKSSITTRSPGPKSARLARFD